MKYSPDFRKCEFKFQKGPVPGIKAGRNSSVPIILGRGARTINHYLPHRKPEFKPFLMK